MCTYTNIQIMSQRPMPSIPTWFQSLIGTTIVRKSPPIAASRSSQPIFQSLCVHADYPVDISRCKITVDLATGDEGFPWVAYASNVQAAARAVIEKCVTPHGQGGFITAELAPIAYIANDPSSWEGQSRAYLLIQHVFVIGSPRLTLNRLSSSPRTCVYDRYDINARYRRPARLIRFLGTQYCAVRSRRCTLCSEGRSEEDRNNWED